MKVEAGKCYVDGHGDLRGPMEERTPGVWIDQWGGVYHPDGTQWNHRPESLGNLTRDAAGTLGLRNGTTAQTTRIYKIIAKR